MQWTWTICFGAIIALVGLGYWVGHTWLPFVGLGLMIPVTVFGNASVARGQACCTLITHYTDYSLFLSSVIMIIINLINSKWVTNEHLLNLQSGIPYIPALVVFTVSTVMYGAAMCRRLHTEYCRACKEQAGRTLRESLQRNVLHAEAKFQLKLAFALCLIMAILGWVYYDVFYINININTPDSFFFFLVPVAVYVLSLVFVFTRYASMQFEVSISPGRMGRDSRTVLRYMVVKDDKILLELVATDSTGAQMWDTPAQVEVPFTEEVDRQQAVDVFRNISGADDFAIKRLFATSKGMSNGFHFAAFLKADEPTPGFTAQGFTLYEINQMMRSGQVARAFAYEIHRVFTITMAWKTYTREGKRLYPIKNYRPTFRLTDFKDWDVDYSDLHWISVAKNNEDQPFFRWRRFWRNHISGVDLRWRKKHS